MASNKRILEIDTSDAKAKVEEVRNIVKETKEELTELNEKLRETNALLKALSIFEKNRRV